MVETRASCHEATGHRFLHQGNFYLIKFYLIFFFCVKVVWWLSGQSRIGEMYDLGSSLATDPLGGPTLPISHNDILNERYCVANALVLLYVS